MITHPGDPLPAPHRRLSRQRGQPLAPARLDPGEDRQGWREGPDRDAGPALARAAPAVRRRHASLRGRASGAPGPAGPRQDRRQSLLLHPLLADAAPGGPDRARATHRPVDLGRQAHRSPGLLRQRRRPDGRAVEAAPRRHPGRPPAGRQPGKPVRACHPGHRLRAARGGGRGSAQRGPARATGVPVGQHVSFRARPRATGGVFTDSRGGAQHHSPAYWPTAAGEHARGVSGGVSLRHRQSAKTGRRPDHRRRGESDALPAERPGSPEGHGVHCLRLGPQLLLPGPRAVARGRLGHPVRGDARAPPGAVRVRIPARRLAACK